jgi:predicted permease
VAFGSPEVGALTTASAFLVASLSITVVIYVLQWNYFNAKRTVQEKEEARVRTLWVFSVELAYVFFALAGLLVNAVTLVVSGDVVVALIFTAVIAGVFVLIVTEEFASSLQHLLERRYATIATGEGRETEPEK